MVKIQNILPQIQTKMKSIPMSMSLIRYFLYQKTSMRKKRQMPKIMTRPVRHLQSPRRVRQWFGGAASLVRLLDGEVAI